MTKPKELQDELRLRVLEKLYNSQLPKSTIIIQRELQVDPMKYGRILGVLSRLKLIAFRDKHNVEITEAGRVQYETLKYETLKREKPDNMPKPETIEDLLKKAKEFLDANSYNEVEMQVAGMTVRIARYNHRERSGNWWQRLSR